MLSGSCAVQAALGRAFDEPYGKIDIDIFCTWVAAPFIRQRLVERCGLICGGVDNRDYPSAWNERDNCGDHEFSRLHHVETYAGRPTEGCYYAHGRSKEYASEAYYTQALEWGASRVEEERLEGGLVYKSMIGMPGGSAGGKFPFDFNLRSREGTAFVQLIIGQREVEYARELLISFDLQVSIYHLIYLFISIASPLPHLLRDHVQPFPEPRNRVRPRHAVPFKRGEGRGRGGDGFLFKLFRRLARVRIFLLL